MRTLFRNARILTFEDECAVEGDLVTDGDRIVYLGGEYGGAADRTVDCEGDVLMPSLVDTHAHLGMTTMRGLADDLPLADWLHDRIFPMEARLDGELVRGRETRTRRTYFGRRDRCGGYVSLSRDHVRFADGERCRGYRSLRRQRRRRRYAAPPRAAGTYACVAQRPRQGYVIFSRGIHLLGRVSRRHTRTVADVAYGCYDAQFGDARRSRGLREPTRGLTPTAALHNMGLFDYGGLVAHCVHCDKDDLALLAQSGVAISVNCASNCKLGSGIPNIFAMKCGQSRDTGDGLGCEQQPSRPVARNVSRRRASESDFEHRGCGDGA